MNYEWQKEFLRSDNSKALLCCEAGTGKSHVAGDWIEQENRWIKPVVLCPKQIVADWAKRCEGKAVSIYTPQTILKHELPTDPSCIIVDEADIFASPLFIAKKRSKCADKLYNYIRQNPDVPVLLLTATPVRSTPWNIHTLLCYLGEYIEWKEWRDKYFFMDQPRFMTRPAYFPVDGWQKMMQPVINEYATVALMKDMLPKDTIEEFLNPKIKLIEVKPPKYERNTEWEASKQFAEDNLSEQPAKDKEIAKISKDYRKLFLVVYRREEIDRLYKKLSKERQTFVLDGRTKDVGAVIADADAADECYFIVQSSVGAGFEVPSFSCMVFVSQDHSVRNHVQMKARIRRGNNIKPLSYYQILGGRCDKMVYENITAGKDFVPSEYQR